MCNNCDGGNGNKSCNDDVYENNKKICDIFVDIFNTNRIVVYSWKGTLTGYIISNEDFSKFDYWNNKYWNDGVNGYLDLPYLYKNDYGGEGTVDILKDLIINSVTFSSIDDISLREKESIGKKYILETINSINN